jgi:Mpv17 / PMP22 family.
VRQNGLAMRTQQNPSRGHDDVTRGAAVPIQIVTQTYSSVLLEHPFLTKATTGFFLCGLGDVLAQCRSLQQSSSALQGQQQAKPLFFDRMDWMRLARFAVKGFFGTCIWALWYDMSDCILSEEHILSLLLSLGFSDIGDALLNALRTVFLVLAEQFVTCPIIYGLWEIPTSTLLNGAPASRIKYEVKDKLLDMLFENAKVWTFANILIYNVPLQYRTGLANIMDVIWQSIVSDFAAKCGKNIEMVGDDEPKEVDEEMVVVTREMVSVPRTSVVVTSIEEQTQTANYAEVT